MPEQTTAVDYAMEAASGPHFSGRFLSSPKTSFIAESIKQPFVIGVSGGTASGKTTVCDMIIQQLHDHRVVLVNQDSFYRGLTAEESERVHEYNFDHPDAFDTEQMLECIDKLRQGNSVHLPIYDFKNHRRCSESFRQVNASDVIILEGILVFHDQRVRDLMNMKIFVDTEFTPSRGNTPVHGNFLATTTLVKGGALAVDGSKLSTTVSQPSTIPIKRNKSLSELFSESPRVNRNCHEETMASLKTRALFNCRPVTHQMAVRRK